MESVDTHHSREPPQKHLQQLHTLSYDHVVFNHVQSLHRKLYGLDAWADGN